MRLLTLLVCSACLVSLLACEDDPAYSGTTDAGSNATSNRNTSTTTDVDTPDTDTPDTNTIADAASPNLDECSRDEECELVDRCGCYAAPLRSPGGGNKDCAISVSCGEIGVERAKCLDGRCVLDSATCINAMCPDAPPSCPEGFVPAVNTTTGCWSELCVHPSDCAEVNSCAQCAGDEVCWESQAGGSAPRCFPLPEACGGEATCSCIGSEAQAHCFGGCDDSSSPLLCLDGG